MPRVSYTNINSNPCLNELVYSVLRSSDREDLLKLRGRFLKAAKSETAAKRFASIAKYEEKALLLAEFGVNFFTVFVNNDSLTSKKLREILNKYEADQNGSAMESLTESQIWVESDKEFIHLLGLMAQTSNHPSYKLNLEAQRAGYHAKRWTVSSKNKNDKNIDETITTFDYLTRLLLQSCLITDRAPTLFNITADEMKLLLYLYSVRHTYVDKDKVWVYFLGNYNKKFISTHLKKLFKMQYLEIHPNEDLQKFTITSLGIGIVNRFLQTTFNQIQ